MAKMRYHGIDAMRVPLDKLLALKKEQYMEVVNAGAAVVLENQQRYLRQHHHRTGELEGSLTIRELPSFRSAIVEAKGVRDGTKMRRIHSRSGKTRRAKHHGLSKGTSMQDVAYYLAIGTRKMRATDWDLKANKEAEEEVGKAMEAVWDKVLSEAGL
jgi:hypothetical protein